MRAKTTAEAWKMANELFPTDYMKDDVVSKRAGYPQYYSTSPEHSNDHINDLNVRLEVVIGGKCTNIWIEEKEVAHQEKVHMSQRLYRDIWMLINGQVGEAEREMEYWLGWMRLIAWILRTPTPPRSAVGQIRDCRSRIHHFEAMLEQFEKEVEG